MSRNGLSCGTAFETEIDEHHCSFDCFYSAKKQMGSSYGKYLVSGILVALALLIPSMINDAYASIPISSCETLNIPGETYVLTNDLTSSGTCFTITASGITLDGNGHTLTGPGSQFGVKVSEYATGFTVKNMNISGFNTGIYVTASDTHVINNILTNMGWSGITVSNSCGVTISENTVHSSKVGIEAKYSTGIKIDKNKVDSNSQNGIRVTSVDGVVISENTALTPGSRGIILQSSNEGFVVDNIASGNEAILLHNSHNNVLINNNIESCSDCNRLYGIGVTGIMIWESNGNSIISNDIESTHLWGVHLLGSSDNAFSGNVISGHHKEIASNAYGLLISNSHRNTFNYNTISDNERPYNIQDSTENKIINNNFISNLNEGRIIVFVEQEGSSYLMAVEDTSGSNIFYDSVMGGNYWDNFDDSSEGCEDLNNDGFCDGVFVAHGTLDNFAWSVPDGWMVHSPVIPDVDSLNIPEAAYCPGSEPKPDVPVCEEPEVLDEATNTCVMPEPDVPVCKEPEVLDEATNTCVMPEPDIPPVEVGLMCHIPPGNPDNAHTIMISVNAFPAHLAHGDYEGACTESDLEILEFSVLTDNEILNDALEILRILRENLDADSDLKQSISKAANLHQLFANEDKMAKKIFQSAFSQFNKDVKASYGDSPLVSEKSILYDLDKAALKIQMQIDKDEKEEQHKNKIQSTRQFLASAEELQKIKNQIFWEEHKYDKKDGKKLESLKVQELDLLKKTLLFNAKVNGEKVSPELVKSIKKGAEEEVEKNHKKNDGNNNSNDDDKSNKGKGNSDKGNSGKGNNGKGNSDKGNSGKGNNGKAKGK